jgi:hypothetical protein
MIWLIFLILGPGIWFLGRKKSLGFRLSLATISAVIFVSALFAGKFAGTDVEFQSSDGEWARPELRFKGDDFEQVVTMFELYRARCSPSVTLQRTTSTLRWDQWDYWFNDFSHPKWKVTYAVRKHADSRYPPTNTKHCANEPTQPEQLQAARQRAKIWLRDGA